MGKLLAVAIIVGIAYYALTQGMPWLKTAMDADRPPAGEGDESGYCISQVAGASDELVAELAAASRPPVDGQVWGTMIVRAAGTLARAENACACPTAACGKATEAVWELRTMFNEFDDMARGNPMGISNPARRQERVNELLEEARYMAATG